jgi:hypothetical protein
MLAVLAGAVLVASVASTVSAHASLKGHARSAKDDEITSKLLCDEGSPLCAEPADAIGYEGHYTGHDEPSLLFYSDTPGAGNNNSTG